MIFKRTVTKKEKRNKARKRLILLLIFMSLVIVNIVLIYKTFFEKPKPIINPLSSNQISSTQAVERKLKENNIEYSSFTTESDLNYLIRLGDESEVILDSGRNVDEQLASLQLILSQLKIEGRALERLDFRYDKPIITFKE